MPAAGILLLPVFITKPRTCCAVHQPPRHGLFPFLPSARHICLLRPHFRTILRLQKWVVLVRIHDLRCCLTSCRTHCVDFYHTLPPSNTTHCANDLLDLLDVDGFPGCVANWPHNMLLDLGHCCGSLARRGRETRLVVLVRGAHGCWTSVLHGVLRECRVFCRYFAPISRVSLPCSHGSRVRPLTDLNSAHRL